MGTSEKLISPYYCFSPRHLSSIFLQRIRRQLLRAKTIAELMARGMWVFVGKPGHSGFYLPGRLARTIMAGCRGQRAPRAAVIATTL